MAMATVTAMVTATWWLAVAAAALWAEGAVGRPQSAAGRSYLPPEGQPFNAPSDDADNLLAPPDQRDALPPFRTDQDSFRLDAQVELVGDDPPPRGRPGSAPGPGRAGTRTGDRSPEELFPDPAAYIPPPPSRLQDPAAAAGNAYLPPGAGATRPASDRDGFGGTRPSSDRDGFGGTRPSSDRDGFGGQEDRRPAARPDGFGGTRPNDQIGFVDQGGIRPTDRDGYGGQGVTRPAEQDGFGGVRPSSDRDGYGGQGGTRPAEQDGYGGTRPSSDRDGFGVKGDRRPVTRPDGFGGTRPSSDRDGFVQGGTRPSSDRDGFGQGGTRPSNDLDGFGGQGDRRPDGFGGQGGSRPTTTQDAFGGQDYSNDRRPSPPPVRTDGQSKGSSGYDGQGLAGDRIPSSGAEGYPAANKPVTVQPGAGYGGQSPPQGSVTNFGGERPTEYGVNPAAGAGPSQGNNGYPPSNSRPGIEQPEFQDSSERPNQGFGGFQQSENIPSTPRPGQEGRPSDIAPNRPVEELPPRRPEGFQPTRGSPQGELGTSGPQGRPEFNAPSSVQGYPAGPGGDANTFASNQRPSDGNVPFSPGSEDSYSPPSGQRPRPIPEYGPPRGGYGTDDTRERPAVRPQTGRPEVRPEGDGRYPTSQTNTYPSNNDPDYRPPAPNNEIGRPENGLASDGFTSGGDQGSDNRRPGNNRPSSRPDSNVDYPIKEQEGYNYDRPSSPGLTEPQNNKYPGSNQYPTRQDSDIPNQIPLSDVDQPLNADKYPQSSRPGSIKPDFPAIGNQRPDSGIGSNAFASPSLAERPTSIGGVANGYTGPDQSTASRPGGSTGYPSPSGGNRRPAGNEFDDVRKPIAPQQGTRPNARPDGEKRPQGNDRRPGGVGPGEFSSETGGYATANPDTPGSRRPVLGGVPNGEAAYPRPGDSSRYPEPSGANVGASHSKGYNYDRPTADNEFGERPTSNGRPGSASEDRYNPGTNIPSQNTQSEFVPSTPQPGFEPSRGNGVTSTFGTGDDSRRPGETGSYPDSSFGTRPGANSASDNKVSGPYGATNNGYNPGEGSSSGYGSGIQRPSVGNELGYPSATSRPGSEGSRPGVEGLRPGVEGFRPGSEGSRPGLEGSRPGLEGSRPGFDGSRPGSEGSIPKEEGPYKYDIPSETLELQEGNRPRNSYGSYGGPSKGDSYSPDRLPAPSSGSSVTRPFAPDSAYGGDSSVASRREQGNYKSARIISGETQDFGRASNDPSSNSNDAASLGSGVSSENPGSPEQQAAKRRPDSFPASPETTLSGQPDRASPVQGRTSEQQGGSPASRVPSSAAGLPVTPSDLATGAVPSPGSRLPSAAVTGEDVKYEEAKYEFQYRVQEPPLAVDFGHHERRVEDLAQGEYFVLLPDGRTQVVEYEADNDGYKPVVRYGDEPPKIFTAGTPSSPISSASGSRVKGSYTPGGSRG